LTLAVQLMKSYVSRPTARVSGGWGEKGSETENYQNHEKHFKNAQSPNRPLHAVLGVFCCCNCDRCK